MILVQGDLIVPFGVSLTIEAAAPQTIVHFLTGGMLIVEGKLNLNGALFTGTDALPWKGVVVHPTAQVNQIASCMFEIDSEQPVRLRESELISNEVGIRVLRGTVIFTCAGCTSEEKEPINPLIKQLSDEDTSVRRNAAFALGEMARPRSLPYPR